MTIFRILQVMLALTVVLGMPPGAGAQDSETQNGLPPVESYPPLPISSAGEVGPARPNIENQGALEAFADGLIEAYMEHDSIAGVTFSIVKDGKLLLAKGYGISGLDPEKVVDPGTTLFRIGSISKTFIWTAIMQLVEAGQLTLDDPVNDHLPEVLKITDQGFDEPIRIRHLMTHTPGFEDTALGHLFSKTAGDVMPLASYMARYRPARVRPAGEVTSYSNYGASLAGVIVSTVSGLRFEDYVDDNILGPLGMTGATFREPLGEAASDRLPAPMAEELAANVSAGFTRSNGEWKTVDFEFITQIGPAGAVSATATDMARYMLAHLQNGRLGDVRILEEATAREMRQRLFSNAPAVNGLAHGFMEYALPGGLHGFGHGGATLYFKSNMILVPDHDLGIFISANTGSGFKLITDFPKKLVERFFVTGKMEALEPPGDFAERGKRFAGTYLSNRRSYTLLEKILQLAGGFARVSVTDDGFLLMSLGGETKRFVETAPLVFREAGGDDVIAFREDDDGDISHLLTPYGVIAVERIGFFEGSIWFGLILGLGFLAAVIGVVGWWLRRKREIEQSKGERLSAQLMGALGAAWIAFLVLFGSAVAQLTALGNEAVFAFPSALLVSALWMAILCALGTLGALATLVPVWRDAHWSLWRRLRHTAAAATSLALTLTLYGWNILGFRYF